MPKPKKRGAKTRSEIDKTLLTTFTSVAEKEGAGLYPLDVQKIHPKESVRLKCLIPMCEYYEVCKVCPPNIPSVSEFREALKYYTQAYLVVLREKIKDLRLYQDDFSAELKLAEIVNNLEVTAFQQGYPQAIGLIVGGCKLCKKCEPEGEPCRHPFRARPSPEGFGVDITELARDTGVPVEWPPKTYVSFLGMVLV